MAAKVFRQMFEEKYIRFPGGRTRAFTLSYDDGVEADRRLLGIIDKYGLRCTFNLNSTLFDCAGWHGRMDEEATYAAFSGGPHEVALHGARHIFLNKVPLPEAIREVALNRDWLEHKFGRIVCGMAYAYNGFNDDVKRVLKDLGGNTRTVPELLWKQSPLQYAPACKTPILFIHSDQDYRCYMAEGLAMFSAVKRNGCPAKMCLFHGENHELSRSGKPENRIDRMAEILNWMDTYLK